MAKVGTIEVKWGVKHDAPPTCGDKADDESGYTLVCGLGPHTGGHHRDQSADRPSTVPGCWYDDFEGRHALKERITLRVGSSSGVDMTVPQEGEAVLAGRKAKHGDELTVKVTTFSAKEMAESIRKAGPLFKNAAEWDNSPNGDPVADIEAAKQEVIDSFEKHTAMPITKEMVDRWRALADPCCPLRASGSTIHDVWCDHWTDPAKSEVEHLNPAGFPCAEKLEALGCPSCGTDAVAYCRTCVVCTCCGESPMDREEGTMPWWIITHADSQSEKDRKELHQNDHRDEVRLYNERILRKGQADMLALGKSSGEEES